MKSVINSWGPAGWTFIHFVALGYPMVPTQEDKDKYRNFFISIKDVLPCKLCALHYSENLDLFPLDDDILSSQGKLFNWTVDIHNEVNKKNNKPIVDYETALLLLMNNIKEIPIKNNIEKFTDVNKKPKYNTLFIIIMIVVVIIILSAFYYKNIYLRK